MKQTIQELLDNYRQVVLYSRMNLLSDKELRRRLLEQPKGCSRLEIRLEKQVTFVEYGKTKVTKYQS